MSNEELKPCEHSQTQKNWTSLDHCITCMDFEIAKLQEKLTEAVEVLEKIYTRFKEWVPRSAYEKDENLMFEAKEFLEKIKNADCL